MLVKRAVFVMLVFSSGFMVFYEVHRRRFPSQGDQDLTATSVHEDFYDMQIKPEIVDLIRQRHLFAPSQETYNLLASFYSDPSMGQSQVIRRLFRNARGGFFVESGALDGETRSNTLYLETQLGWSGILVEPDPQNFEMMVAKRRKAWLVNVCLGVHPYPEKVTFWSNMNVGKIVNVSKNTPVEVGKLIDVQCFPFYSILTALNVTTIDYFSLDVEGAEFEVLRTIPFHRLNIKTLSVEFSHDQVEPRIIQAFMEKRGYEVVTLVTKKSGLANDFIFAKKGYFQQE